MSWSTQGSFFWVGLVGLAGGACGSVNDALPIDAAVRSVTCTGQPLDILPNGNFDAADPPWRQDPPALLCGEPRLTPHSGAFAGCLGGVADAVTHTLSRDVLLPAGAVSAKLTGQLCISTEETEPLDNDILTFELLDGPETISSLARRTNQQGSPACQFESFMVEVPLTRDPVTATFRVQAKTDLGKSTSFFVDTLNLSVTCL